MADLNLDPQLMSHSPSPRGGSVTLPSRSLEDPDAGSGSEDEVDGAKEGDNDDTAGKKRRKLNLWKCKQCREARKKCLPEDRVWPGQKCIRCLQHRPGELECSKPEMNTRTRGKNVPKDKDTTLDARRSKTASTPDRSEPKRVASDIEDLDSETAHNRPVPITIKRIKRERQGTLMESVIEKKETSAEKEQPPAVLYLPLAEDQFRILQLEPGKKDEMLKCSFLVESINSPLDYEAISYLWGGNNNTQQLTFREIELLDDQQPPKSYHIFIRSNLHSALHSLRHPTRLRRFWVDALCINRSNEDEVNHQVAMKSLIFYNAENLCFWLGDDPSYRAAIAFIPQIVDLKEVDKLVNEQSMVEKWLSFVTLLKNNVFSRLWLVQEVAIAWNVTLHCGASTIHYTDFVDAVTIFLSCRKHISTLFRADEKNPRTLTDQKIVMVERFIDITTNALRRDPQDSQGQGKSVQRLLNLEALVSNLSDLSSGKHVDRIYSVLALAKDGPPLFDAWKATSEGSLRIDYGKSVLDVYQDFFIHVVTNSQTLDIMCRRWATCVPEKEASLPTWIRPLQSSLQPPIDSKASERTDYDRTDADSLVGIPDHRWYNAAKNTKATFRIGLPAASNEKGKGKEKVLFVRGFRLDTISRLGPRAAEGIILYEWLQLGGCILSDEVDTVPEPFWRTIVADRGPNGSNVPSWYRRAFLYCLAESTPNGDINTKGLIKACEAGSTLVVDFLQRVQSVIWNRKFLVSEGRLIGLAPMAAQERDVICILYGCSVPVVLREITVKGETFWQLVGECYVHGKMDGEAMEGRDPDDPMATEEFEIR
ncbi:heterokaryon incompatibility protein-domain-containing protein [Leptodontidium sp. 2 PMI_412]|nr:heterokaryon incompatibility protein-domain-containing protein [Leptodontidium sp. 2 PMI_412]